MFVVMESSQRRENEADEEMIRLIDGTVADQWIHGKSSSGGRGNQETNAT
jgi:hypothetical protein